MGSMNSVFASKTERENFIKLQRTWAEGYNLWHNLPFLNVFNTNGLVDLKTGKKFALEQIELNRLKKTSIDYV